MSENTTDNVLVQKITADTQSRVDEVHTHAKAEVADIEHETQKQIETLQTEAKLQLKKKTHQQELVGVSKARQAANIARQTAKRNAVDTAFATAFSELSSLSSDEYVAFFTKHVEAVVPKGSEATKVFAPEKRADETKAIMKAALDATVEVTPTAASKAGLIVETADGVFDITLERLMSEKRSSLEIEVVNEVMS
jgi:vacuolar-type H+-ATPase subunit E/Vma4